ncbi:unnamed protein product [Dibothriocephalus latus]|uniref:Methyltransferase type 11 domain-containing protein n=1 Tax=Dibothriocephalus latus TaxID=60516 RepID=A0A3P7NV41_DIBLA|nr:unnamed protein product [Dibothriocephalus latus]
MTNILSRAFKCPDFGLTAILLNSLIFRRLNKSLNKYVVEECRLQPGETVLDVGCACGTGLKMAVPLVAPRTAAFLRFNPPARLLGPQWLARLGLKEYQVNLPLDADGFVHGVDISPFMVQLSLKHLRPFHKADRVAIHQNSVHRLPMPTQSVDVCFHVDSFYFWPSLDDSLAEIHRVLRPGGRIVTAFQPSRLRFYTRLGMMRFARVDALAYSMSLEANGFTDVEWIKPEASNGFHCIRARKPPLTYLPPPPPPPSEARTEEIE